MNRVNRCICKASSTVYTLAYTQLYTLVHMKECEKRERRQRSSDCVAKLPNAIQPEYSMSTLCTLTHTYNYTPPLTGSPPLYW